MAIRSRERSTAILVRIALAIMSLAAFLSSSMAGAEDEKADRRWVPSLGLGVLVQTASGSGSGSTTWPACTPTFPDSECYGGRPDAAGSPDFFAGVPDVRIGLLSPPIPGTSGRIRHFAHAGWQYGWGSFETEEAVASEGGFGEVLIPTIDNDPVNVAGVGSRMFAETRNGWFAGLGLAVDVTLGDYDFRVLSSIDYFGQRISARAESRRVAENVDPVEFVLGLSLDERAVFRLEEISGASSKVFHSVGPRIGVETEMGRIGPIAVNGFAEIATLFLLGDRDLRVVATGEGSGAFSLKLDPVIVQGGLGVRFAWSPQRRNGD